MKPLVSIVIPAYNAAFTIANCIQACLAQDYPQERLEIIVVDDGSRDTTKAIATRFPVKYIYQENSGPAQARNEGWRAAGGEIACFTDSDCIPDTDWISRLVANYTCDEIGGVGGTYGIANSDSLLAVCIHEETVQRHLHIPRYVDYLGSFNLSYRKQVLQEVGGFDESYRIASGEDNDLAYRIMKRGYKLVFDRDAVVAHHHPSNLIRYLRQQFWHGYWRMKLYRNHPDMARGDTYGGLADFIQPPLALATLCLVPIVFLLHIAYLLFALLIVGMTLQLPMSLAIIKRTRQIKYLALVPVTFLRGYARGLGMAWGIFGFFISLLISVRLL